MLNNYLPLIQKFVFSLRDPVNATRSTRSGFLYKLKIVYGGFKFLYAVIEITNKNRQKSYTKKNKESYMHIIFL